MPERTGPGGWNLPSEIIAVLASFAAVCPATSAAALHVFALIGASVVGAAAPAAAFSFRQASVAPAAGGPAPASAGVSVAPALASQIASPALAGTSCPASGFQCLERRGAQQA